MSPCPHCNDYFCDCLMSQEAQPKPATSTSVNAPGGAPSAADIFFASYETVLNRHPHVLIEIGHNRIADWGVHVYDASGVGIRAAPLVISVQHHNRDSALLEASEQMLKKYCP